MASARPARGGGNAVLNVVHGIPGVDVNVCVNGAAAIPDCKPGDVATGVELPAGSYDVKIVAAADTCDDAAILEANGVALKAGKNYTAVANLNADGDPNIKLFTNKVAPVKAGKARLTVRHTAAAPAVNVWANGSVLIGGTTSSGASRVGCRAEGFLPREGHVAGSDGSRDGPATLKLKAGFAYQVYAWGTGPTATASPSSPRRLARSSPLLPPIFPATPPAAAGGVVGRRIETVRPRRRLGYWRQVRRIDQTEEEER